MQERLNDNTIVQGNWKTLGFRFRHETPLVAAAVPHNLR
ncbi:phosphoribosylaminoimidazole carboxylase [Streptococcus mitis]|uniref:Phosphoribosylaminoimidazole carboxylase n=1 Tax=Streptococcus mitis TaxID=28037 RepID=A0A1T0BZM3_STRMT|nr:MULTISPECIES: phosphoribosylaminoimidazole carboxylase [Streptococcus]ECB9524080.1 phosphoribosylaminoimidazole carboxylase [Listeria monocytogenes]MCP9059955.1 phosphoribosylaminoimidazole carboxylase [Streptococcus sp. CF7_Ac1-12]MCP9084404.1 phosphoribosylaminoimidazole carboxylase [Streptococcus sp. CF7_Ac1-8]MCB8699287.1 phosphoribosylaminoimidazole carboxylase [Streptococcus mitis]MCC0092769.1 phosphoribosylaminoimidazole carboxylase [Streptococcus mitis]